LELKAIDLACQRIERPELLDLGLGSDQDVAENLAEMQHINDFLGGTPALTRHLYPRLHRQTGPVTVLDLGTGGAGLPALLVGRARKMGLPMRVLALDWSRRNLAVACRATRLIPEIQLLQADALALPLGSGQVDYVISSLFMHHLSADQLVRVLRQAYQLARRAVIMSDLVRGWLPYLGYQLIQPVFAHNHLTRQDGSLSIRRAYTPKELGALALQAGLPEPRLYTHFPWRMTLVAEK
jgi:SAM-dependent methyltransferase